VAWWQVVLGVVVGLIILSIIVIIHELGHALTAIRGGVKIEEFGIGFPPRAWSTTLKKKHILPAGTVISINWLPIGGFCQMQGESDDASGKGTYGAASLWSKTKILLAGVWANFLTAVVLLMVLAWVGMPVIFSGQFEMPGDTREINGPVIVSDVVKGLPAETVGLKSGDRILKMNGKDITDSTQIPAFTAAEKGKKITIDYERCDANGKNCSEKTARTTLRADDADGKGYLGMTSGQNITLKSTWSAPIVAVATAGQYVGLTFSGLGQLFADLGTGIWGAIMHTSASANLAAAGDSVAGPVGILGQIFPAALAGGGIQLTYISAIIALSLAVMNILPIPGLDGGRWYLTLIYRFILRRPLKEETEAKINAVGMIILFALIILITIVDIMRIV
jgi:regulator of sigma E protease